MFLFDAVYVTGYVFFQEVALVDQSPKKHNGRNGLCLKHKAFRRCKDTDEMVYVLNHLAAFRTRVNIVT